MMKYSLDLICSIDRNGHLVYVNDACERILGYSSSEVLGRHFFGFIPLDEQERTRAVAEQTLAGLKTTTFEHNCVHKSGQLVPMLWSMVWSVDDAVSFCTGRDISELVLTRQKVREKDDLHQALISHGSDMLALFDEKGTYLYSAGATLEDLGYLPEQLIGRNAFNLIHPEDVPKVEESLALLLENPATIRKHDLRFISATGVWRWLEATFTNQLHNPHIKALVANAHDVTEQRTNAKKLSESEQRFKALFENNPDIVVTENESGIIVDINLAGVSFLNMAKQEIVGRSLADLLPLESRSICVDYLRQAFEGQTVKLEQALHIAHVGEVVLDITKIPVTLNGKVVAVHSIVKDITAITKSHNTVKQQAKKLNTLFRSIKDAFCIIDKNWNYVYTNSEFDRILNPYYHNLLGRNIWEVFPDGIGSDFYKQYTYAMASGNAVNFEAYSPELKSWLDIKAYPSEEGLLLYFRDITAKVKAQQELEKLSLVASAITNGVIITDPDRRIEWVNQGFTNLTGYNLEEATGQRPSELLHNSNSDALEFELVKEKMLNGEPVAFEVLNSRKDGEEIWLSVQVNPICDKEGRLQNYITTQTDITALKKSELELAELAKDLYRHNRDMQQFTYIVSHNLRAPVANVIGLSDMLQKFSRDSEIYDKSLVNLKRSITQLDVVLKDLSAILSIRDSKHVLEQEPIELGLKCQQVLESLREPLQACGGSITLDIKQDTYVRGNSAYLYSIFYNLLSNAIKYRAADRPLEISVKLYGDTRLGKFLAITDNGTGFDMTRAGKDVFKLYKRFHATADGRGIGLYLTRAHLEAMGGSIKVDSQIGIGTRFLLQLK